MYYDDMDVFRGRKGGMSYELIYIFGEIRMFWVWWRLGGRKGKQ